MIYITGFFDWFFLWIWIFFTSKSIKIIFFWNSLKCLEFAEKIFYFWKHFFSKFKASNSAIKITVSAAAASKWHITYTITHTNTQIFSPIQMSIAYINAVTFFIVRFLYTHAHIARVSSNQDCTDFTGQLQWISFLIHIFISSFVLV